MFGMDVGKVGLVSNVNKLGMPDIGSGDHPVNDAMEISNVIMDLLMRNAGAEKNALSLLERMDGGFSSRDATEFLERNMTSVLTSALKSTGLLHEARTIYLLWPNLKSVTERFCHYITPLLGGVSAHTLLEESLVNAIESFHSEINESAKVRAYLFGLVRLAGRLTNVLVRGKFRRGYVVWTPFSQPITDWMMQYQLNTIETLERKSASNDMTARTFLLTKIIGIDDFDIAQVKLFAEASND